MIFHVSTTTWECYDHRVDKTFTLSVVAVVIRGWTTNRHCQLAEVTNRRFPEISKVIFNCAYRFVPLSKERFGIFTGKPHQRRWTKRCGSVRAAGAATPDQRFGCGRSPPLGVGPCRLRSQVAFVCRPPPIAVTAAREPAAALSARPPSL